MRSCTVCPVCLDELCRISYVTVETIIARLTKENIDKMISFLVYNSKYISSAVANNMLEQQEHAVFGTLE